MSVGGSEEVAVHCAALVDIGQATEIESGSLLALNATAAILQGHSTCPQAIGILVERIEGAGLCVWPFAIGALFIVEVTLHIDDTTYQGILHQFVDFGLSLLVRITTKVKSIRQFVDDSEHLLHGVFVSQTTCDVGDEVVDIIYLLIDICTPESGLELFVDLAYEAQLLIDVTATLSLCNQ